MCGIAGYYLKNKQNSAADKVNALIGPIRQRGPDDEGVCLISRDRRAAAFFAADRSIPEIKAQYDHIEKSRGGFEHDLALVHTRYSIIDLSVGGHQPFLSREKSVAVIFNGEIYNYIELKKELSSAGVQFKTSSDTEVLAEGYALWGEGLWARINGFWAAALYNFKTDEFILSRDRIGVAPLYYRETSDGFYFSSSLGSLLRVDPKGLTVNRDVLQGFLDTGIKDHDRSTYYQEIKSVPSKSSVILKSGQFNLSEGKIRLYWDFPAKRLKADEIPFQEALERFRKIFFDAVDLRLRSDVKVAFELSGGLDSSAIVAAAAILRKNDITTYTAKVKNADEEPYARMMLKEYPVDYRVIEYAEEGLADDLSDFSLLMEEPFDNPNAYTHHKMLRSMKQEGVHVVVTGAGGDEVFAGYEAGFWPKVYQELRRQGLNQFLKADIYEFLRRFKTVKRSKETIKHYLCDPCKVFKRDQSSDKRGADKLTAAYNYQKSYSGLSFHEQTLFHFNTALVPFYMRSSDHFAMGIPIEQRFPLLDYRLVEFGLQLPAEYLFCNGWTKYFLRKAMEPYLPKGIVWRREKMGFRFPYQKFFTVHREVFEKIFLMFKSLDQSLGHYGSYQELLNSDPQLLWRIISTEIWLKNIEGKADRS